MLVDACFQLRRRSTTTAGSFEFTLMRHRMPRQVTVAIVALVDAPPRSTMSSGTTHSCRLTPPWE